MNKPIRDWAAQRVWIIGASSGIGAALALALLERGAHVAVSARRAEALHALVAGHPQARVLTFDVTERECLRPAGDELFRPGAASTWWSFAPAPMRRCAPGSWTRRHRPAARHQPARADGAGGAPDTPPAEAGQRRAGLRLQRRRLSRPAQGGGLWPDQGGADQFRRNPVPRPRAARPLGVPHQSRLRRDADDRRQRFRNAGADQPATGRHGNHRRLRSRQFRDPLSAPLHALAQAAAPAALRSLLPPASAGTTDVSVSGRRSVNHMPSANSSTWPGGTNGGRLPSR
jgi:hypothetical protein